MKYSLTGESQQDNELFRKLYPSGLLETPYWVVAHQKLRFFDLDTDTIHVYEVIRESPVFYGEDRGEIVYLLLSFDYSEQLSDESVVSDVVLSAEEGDDIYGDYNTVY